MICVTEVPLKTILLGLETFHQTLKHRYLQEFGIDGLGSNNNGKTLKWLGALKRDGGLDAMVCATRSLAEVLRHSGDLSGNYDIIRQVYGVSPSLHEVWFFDTHLQYNFKQLFHNRLGFKAYLTSSANGTLDRSLQGICTTILRQTVLLENMICSHLEVSLMDRSVMPSSDIDSELRSLVIDFDVRRITTRLVIDQMPRIFSLVRGLLELSRSKQLRSPTLLRNWAQYAPCAINCGPIFKRKTSSGLLDVFRSIPSLDEGDIKAHLRTHFDVVDIFPDRLPISLA